MAGEVELVSQTRGRWHCVGHLIVRRRERLAEVKTTGLGKFFPFSVSVTEVRCSEDTDEQYHLYRVFDFSTSPRLYLLRGSLSVTCRPRENLARAGLTPHRL